MLMEWSVWFATVFAIGLFEQSSKGGFWVCLLAIVVLVLYTVLKGPVSRFLDQVYDIETGYLPDY